MAFEVGSDVEAMCNTCNDVWHVVVAKVGDKITKVECKQCGKQHRFKPTGDAPEANLKPVRRTVVRAQTPGGAGSGAKKAGRSSAKADTRGVVLDPNKPTRDYSLRERFSLDEQIQHAKFGPGIVRAVEDDKIHVEFAEGAKVLLHGRA
jgi:hypothetical protein